MRRFIALTALLLVLSFFNTAVAENAVTEDPKMNPNEWRMVSAIDGIEVPEEILIQIQMDYPGHAATKASKTVRNGQELYALRVDRDDNPSDYDSFYLLYNSDWQSVGKEDLVAPQPVFQPEPAPEQPASAEPDETPQTPETPKPPQPEEPPVEEVPDEGGEGGGEPDSSGPDSGN